MMKQDIEQWQAKLSDLEERERETESEWERALVGEGQ